MAHELRTPLSLISGNAQRLERLLADSAPDSDAAARDDLRVRADPERLGPCITNLTV